MGPEKDIHIRIYGFVVRVINLTKFLPKNPQNDRIIPQLVDSSSSMGANDQEAVAASSRKDYIQKYCIVKKENKETIYWLNLVGDVNPIIKPRLKELINEGNEILRIISAIILSSKRKI